MERSRNTAALILKRAPYREDDLLVTVYTPDQGKLNLVARGAQKLQSKLAGHLEPLTLADIMIIPGKGFDYIASAISREIYAGIRGDLNKLYYAGQALQIFNRRVGNDQPDAHLFFLLGGWLETLTDLSDFSPERGELLLMFFVWQFLAELGYKPEMYKCLACGQAVQPGQNYFDLLKGGVICLACFREEQRSPGFISTNLLTISDNCVKMIRFILENKFRVVEKIKLDKKSIKELSTIGHDFLNFNF